jgi:hypothetical protein
VWLCNVTHDVLGEHPENLYIIDIKAFDNTKKVNFVQKIFGSVEKK